MQFHPNNNNEESFTAGMPLGAVIETNHHILPVMARFGLPLGYGDHSVAEVCEKHGVDTPTFLAVINYISRRRYDASKLSLGSLMHYLRNAHAYFLEFQLPTIRRKLIEAIDGTNPDDVAFLILRFFDDYVREVSQHMLSENDRLFPYTENLLKGIADGTVDLRESTEGHAHIVEALNELKNIFIYHYGHRDNNLLNSTLFDLYNCEQDLLMHCSLEDKLFMPALRRLEKYVARDNKVSGEAEKMAESNISIESISDRERDIIRCVALGMANKEIADKLCLSIHTVTTYRRNLSAKLNIHSPAGLTIFAIIHGLIKLEEVNLTR